MDISTLQPGDLILSHIKDQFWSEAISTVTHSKWSHVMVYIGNGLVIEASGAAKKIQYQKVTYYQSAKMTTAAFRVKGITSEQVKILIDFCQENIGLKYGFFQALFILMAISFRSLKSKFFQREMDGGMICSELIARGLEKASLHLFNKNPSMVIPADYANNSQLEQIF